MATRRSPSPTGEKVFITSGYEMGSALLQVDRGAPRVVWKSKEMANHFNSCVLWEGHL